MKTLVLPKTLRRTKIFEKKQDEKGVLGHLFWLIFSHSELSIQKSQGNRENLKVSNKIQTIEVNTERLNNKQINENKAGS